MDFFATQNVLIVQGLLDVFEEVSHAPQAELQSIKTALNAILQPDAALGSAEFEQRLAEIVRRMRELTDDAVIDEILTEAETTRWEDPVLDVSHTHGVTRHSVLFADGELPQIVTRLASPLRPIKAERTFRSVPVFFATDRERSGKSSPQRFFKGNRGELQFGVVEVSIPEGHRRGRLEQPKWWNLFAKTKPKKHVCLLSLTGLLESTFIDKARYALQSAELPQVLVMIHGYNVTFAAAALRAAQICVDLGFRGLPLLYSWPSVGRWYRYTVDETNIEWTVPHFKQVDSLIANELGARGVHILAHSMGNRLLQSYLVWLASQPRRDGQAELLQILMAAPDIDADVFRATDHHAWRQGRRTSLYASSRDWALRLSKIVNGYPRAGDSGRSMVVVGGVDALDASCVETGLFGHSYYGDSRSILSDLELLIRHGHGPDDRPELERRSEPDRLYWRFKP